MHGLIARYNLEPLFLWENNGTKWDLLSFFKLINQSSKDSSETMWL